ncbi:MAG: ABC transporter ATP-binding protein [Chloroflexi bacterium]|nr:ABC transporter ATP-binding protein [Chloroflexota bacterium]
MEQWRWRLKGNQPPDDVIKVEGLVKRFGTLAAVDGISFSVRRGEVFGILGPNGAGKTTALECIEGLQKPTAGQIQVLGMDLQRDAEQVKARIGVQLQASAYFEYLTLREILRLFGRFYPHHVPPDELLSKVSLSEKANTTVGKLSGGQRQRFTIAATLVNDPDVVFLDEPTTGLDPQARRSLWDFIQEIHREGRTVVLTTHYMEEAEFLCQRVAIMDRGKIVALDTPTNLVRALPTPYQVKVVAGGDASKDGLEALDCVKGVGFGEDGAFYLRSADAARTLPALLTWANQSQVRLEHLEVQPATLEDVFLELTGHALRE